MHHKVYTCVIRGWDISSTRSIIASLMGLCLSL